VIENLRSVLAEIDDANRADLAVQLRQHDRGWWAFANSLAAVHGWGSTVGHVLDRCANESGLVALAVYDLDLDAPERVAECKEPSPVAARMIAHEHRRSPRRRLSPMPAACRDAARAYIDMQVHLLDAALDAMEGRGASRERFRRANTFKRRMLRLLDRIENVTPA
jgi:hypothetical protein